MGSVTHPRGRLPRRVYWFRRGLVLALALVLVFGIGKLVGGTGEDGTPPSDTASRTAARQSQGPGVVLGPVAPSKQARAKVKAPLLPPSGECRADEISVLPSVPVARGGAPIEIRLQLQGTQPACSFEVSPESVVVKISSGPDRIWSSQECPDAVPTTDVVVRSGTPAEVPVTWSGRRSDEQCTRQPAWALPGFYHVHAAVLGSAATDVQFEVTPAGTRTVTRTPRPTASATASARPTATPTRKPPRTQTQQPTPRGTPTARP